jgi:putative Holliday junction resolvase
VIGLDIGTRRIGVAVSDELGMIAVPDRVILVAQTPEGEGNAIDDIIAYARNINASHVVAGMPRNMKGAHGVQSEWTASFVARLRLALTNVHIPLGSIDERWSTTIAERFDQERPDWLLEDQWARARDRRDVRNQVNRRSRKRHDRDRDLLDARAAAVILQSYLDRERLRRERSVDASDSRACRRTG